MLSASFYCWKIFLFPCFVVFCLEEYIWVKGIAKWFWRWKNYKPVWSFFQWHKWAGQTICLALFACGNFFTLCCLKLVELNIECLKCRCWKSGRSLWGFSNRTLVNQLHFVVQTLVTVHSVHVRDSLHITKKNTIIKSKQLQNLKVKPSSPTWLQKTHRITSTQKIHDLRLTDSESPYIWSLTGLGWQYKTLVLLLLMKRGNFTETVRDFLDWTPITMFGESTGVETSRFGTGQLHCMKRCTSCFVKT